MKDTFHLPENANSKGAAIFKKMLEDKKYIHEHLKKGGTISELKDKFKFVKPVPTPGA